MAHKFNPKEMEKLDNPWRREILPPLKTLLEAGLKQGETFVDIGCGLGYFTIPGGQIVGDQGMAIGIDTSEEMLEELDRRAKEAGVTRIKGVRSTEYDLTVADGIGDLCFLVNVLHEIDEKDVFLKEVRRITKTGGRVVVIEWIKSEMNMGPPMAHRLGMEEIESLMRGQDFQLESTKLIGEFFISSSFISK